MAAESADQEPEVPWNIIADATIEAPVPPRRRQQIEPVRASKTLIMADEPSTIAIGTPRYMKTSQAMAIAIAMTLPPSICGVRWRRRHGHPDL
jgi:hypothetical protein